jgi:prokaryotic ubiquitin-like protein Pup
MSEREQVRKTPREREASSETESPAVGKQGEKIKAELDDLLDEIDEVLETNAEEFVKSYVQKGGQ